MRCAAQSPSGELLALAGDEQIVVYEVTGWSERWRLATLNETHLDGGDWIETTDLAFYGEERLLVGWHASDDDGDWTGFDIFALEGEAPAVEAQVENPALFASDLRLRADPDLGRVTTSVGASGTVIVFREAGWSPLWRVDYGGGNPAGLHLRRGGHPRWLGISGMMPDNARLVDLVAGEEVLPKEALEGCFRLSPSDSGRAVVAISDRALRVIDVERQALRFVRREELDGSFRLTTGPAYE